MDYEINDETLAVIPTDEGKCEAIELHGNIPIIIISIVHSTNEISNIINIFDNKSLFFLTLGINMLFSENVSSLSSTKNIIGIITLFIIRLKL